MLAVAEELEEALAGDGAVVALETTLDRARLPGR